MVKNKLQIEFFKCFSDYSKSKINIQHHDSQSETGRNGHLFLVYQFIFVTNILFKNDKKLDKRFQNCVSIFAQMGNANEVKITKSTILTSKLIILLAVLPKTIKYFKTSHNMQLQLIKLWKGLLNNSIVYFQCCYCVFIHALIPQ